MSTTDGPGPVDAPGRDPLGLLRGGESVILGTVVCGAVIAAGAGGTEAASQLVTAIVGTVLVYALAHVHAAVLGAAVAHGHHPGRTVRHALVHAVPMLLVSLVPVGVLVVANLLGADLRTAATVALLSTTALLGLYSYLAGSRRGLGVGPSLLTAAAGGGLGILLVLLKSLH